MPHRPRPVPRDSRWLLKNGEMNKALIAPEMQKYLDSIGFNSLGGSPEELGTSPRQGIAIYGEAVTLARLQPE